MSEACVARLSPWEAGDALRWWIRWTETHRSEICSIAFVRGGLSSFVLVEAVTSDVASFRAVFGLPGEASPSPETDLSRVVDLPAIDVDLLLEILGPIDSMLLDRFEIFRLAGAGFQVRLSGRFSATLSRAALHEHIEGLVEALGGS